MKKLREDFKFGVKYQVYSHNYYRAYHCACGKSTFRTRNEYYENRGDFECECGNKIFKEINYPSRSMKSTVHGIYSVTDKKDKAFILHKTEIIAHFKESETKGRYDVDFYEGKNYKANYSIKDKKLEVYKEERMLPEDRWGEFFRGGLPKTALLELISDEKNKPLYNHAFIYFLPRRLTDSQRERKWFVALKRIFEEPYLELFASCNFSDLQYAMSNVKNSEATKPHEILGISKLIFNVIKSMDRIPYSLVENLTLMEKAFNGNGLKSVINIFEEESDLVSLNRCADDMIELYGKGYKDVSKLSTYATREAKLQQGIMIPDHALVLLRDYIKMQNALGRECDKYPKSLKKEHDIAMMNYKAKKDKIKAKMFKEAVEEEQYQSLCCEGKKDDNYFITVPDSSESLINEGSSLSHCVASYVSEVIDKKCKIVFLRDKEVPEESLVTIEVRKSSVRQVRGKHNRSATPKEREFISKWAAEKELECSF